MPRRPLLETETTSELWGGANNKSLQDFLSFSLTRFIHLCYPAMSRKPGVEQARRSPERTPRVFRTMRMPRGHGGARSTRPDDSAIKSSCGASKLSQSNQVVRPDAPAEQQRWEPRRRTPRTSSRTWPIKLDVSEEISSLKSVPCHRTRHLLFGAAAVGSFRDSGTLGSLRK